MIWLERGWAAEGVVQQQTRKGEARFSIAIERWRMSSMNSWHLRTLLERNQCFGLPDGPVHCRSMQVSLKVLRKAGCGTHAIERDEVNQAARKTIG